MTIEKLWNSIEKEADAVRFETVRGLPFIVDYHGEYVEIIRKENRYTLYKSQFEKALNTGSTSCQDLNKAGVFGPSYISAIIRHFDFRVYQKRSEWVPV